VLKGKLEDFFGFFAAKVLRVLRVLDSKEKSVNNLSFSVIFLLLMGLPGIWQVYQPSID
jgi:hypothetical protein